MALKQGVPRLLNFPVPLEVLSHPGPGLSFEHQARGGRYTNPWVCNGVALKVLRVACHRFPHKRMARSKGICDFVSEGVLLE